ncbi:hypothetical protein SAMN04515680_0601 [Leifsonia sp. 21MFCrub1.1]|nr:hypothetical protein SAMN04515680_0601 [Leifsonia sp. 21MFCrub1.1]
MVAQSLGVGGTVLTGAPLAIPILFMVATLFAGGPLRFDVLMPGELVAFVVAGAAALVVAAVLARSLRWATGTGLAAIVAFFVLTGVSADLTGLASGDTPAEGWPRALVVGAYTLYVLAVIADTVVGVLLCRRLFAPGSGRA